MMFHVTGAVEWRARRRGPSPACGRLPDVSGVQLVGGRMGRAFQAEEGARARQGIEAVTVAASENHKQDMGWEPPA